jgi:hypothetical protein
LLFFFLCFSDAEHTLANVILNVVSDIAAFYYMLTRNIPLPQPVWQLSKSYFAGNISLTVPKSTNKAISLPKVQMWYADTIPGNGRRDFRFIRFPCSFVFRIFFILFFYLKSCPSVECLEPVFWFPRTVAPQADGSYFAERKKPVLGWSGFLLQMEFDVETDRNLTFSFRVSTEVNVVPDEFPFPPCPAKYCNNPPN